MSTAQMYHDEGIKKYNRGAHGEAAAAFQKALAAYEEEGKADMVAEMHANLGVIARDQRRYDDAINELTEALDVFEGLDDPKRLAMVKGNLAGVMSSKGEKEAAYALYVEAADSFQDLGEKELHRDTLQAMASLQLKRGKLNMGREILTDASNMEAKKNFNQRMLQAAVNFFTFKWARKLMRMRRGRW